jgi:hypothetical protein
VGRNFLLQFADEPKIPLLQALQHMLGLPEARPAEEERDSLLRSTRRRGTGSSGPRSMGSAAAPGDAFDEDDAWSAHDKKPPAALARPPAQQAFVQTVNKVAMALAFLLIIVLLTVGGVSDTQKRELKPVFTPYPVAQGEHFLTDSHFAQRGDAHGCAKATRVVCEVPASAALSRTLDIRAHALAALLPCWSFFYRWPGARRVIVLSEGLRLGSDPFSAILIKAMKADVIFPSAEPDAPGGELLPPAPCAVHVVRRGPARSGWPAEQVPPDPPDDGKPLRVGLDGEDINESWGHRGNVSSALLRKVIASRGPIAYVRSVAEMRTLADMLAPQGVLPEGGGRDFLEGEGPEPFGLGNLSLAVGLLEPEGGLSISRTRLTRSILRRTLGDGVRVRSTELKEASPAEQAHFVRAHGVLVVSHGAGSEAVMFAAPCTAVLELYPDYHYRPGLYLPLALSVGGIAHTGSAGANAARHTWQRLAGVGMRQAENVLPPPHIMPNAFCGKVVEMIAERERCLAQLGSHA